MTRVTIPSIEFYCENCEGYMTVSLDDFERSRAMTQPDNYYGYIWCNNCKRIIATMQSKTTGTVALSVIKVSDA